MVTVKQFEDDLCLWKYIAAPEQPKCPWLPLKGIKVPLYWLGSHSAVDNGIPVDFSCIPEEQSLLDSLLLAQWEDRTWKGLLRYDITTCEMKVIDGKKKFIAQFNEGYLNPFPELEESKFFKKEDHLKFNCMRMQREALLFCVKSGEKTNPEFVHSSTIPNDATLVIVNVNPVEYGHVFLVPCGINSPPQCMDSRSLEMAIRVAVEINNCCFRVSFDYSPSYASGLYFQACYFSNPLPVELMPVVTLCGPWQERGMHIQEILNYPVKVLSVKGTGTLKSLIKVVAEICSSLQEQEIPYSLLMSDYGTKVFLFPQLHTLETSGSLSAWECAGHVVFKARSGYDEATEEDVLKRLGAFSLNDEQFGLVKQLCCNVASKLAS
ncbi:PREDICTED: GDP-L-galactose phosphorylase 1-like [Nelumbo nucifera]|uniref:GDP-L-galactose phosphorylase 1-like n=1 Tax=Nelumbo nucifera TaxID=4432 RepID=A0A1U7YXP1_NELNU|nr:PREDICTED: GDP-L-galactose phosphorylase 1-like [Nelumbo nucifera]XP_019051770.1 PREDICTED: GDP-L-galactose phosphorylase 1-like [Nelumbo nucifera]